MLGMESHGKYIPTELSGGQQQKVTIARALVTEPDVIIADEPTGSLDSASADKVMEMLRILNEDQKKTVIMVTHNIDYVRFASRTVYIRDGRVIQGSEQFLQ
ncbi:MAG: ATP-binding cassette domain-containing protein, partial [Patescibacteria group bacterium]|nr:ATP-binding cassette domain-containing protein [Patescibacteria group bacterium]